MTSGDTEVLIVGGGAAGIAAARRLAGAGLDSLIVEARSRLGGRAWTVPDGPFPLDLGCGWLHSGDRNPWTGIAESEGLTIDRTPPPWTRRAPSIGFPHADQLAFVDALTSFHERLANAGGEEPDRPAATVLEPGNRWNGLIGAVSTYLNGVEPDRVSAQDFSRYDDSGVNWRVREGYGTAVSAHGAGLPAVLSTTVTCINHSGQRISAETSQGTSLSGDAVIVTVPSAILAEERLRFSPNLPDKIDAAAGVPLGLDDKLFLSLSGAEEFEKDSRIFGRTDRIATAAYHMRPFGAPAIEAYFGGSLAAELEKGGEDAFVEFAVDELVHLLGSGFARRVKYLHLHRWGVDPFSRGSYSHALPGKADSRERLAAAVDNRLFFAGEACSVHDFSTAHGAYLSGIAAADQAIAALRR